MYHFTIRLFMEYTPISKDTSDFGWITNKKDLLLQDVLDITLYNLVIYYLNNNFNTASINVNSGMIIMCM